MAAPRLSQPQHTVLMFWSMPDLCCQISAPVFASSAKTSSLPVVTYITPSFTIGVVSSEYLAPRPEPRWTTQAPLRFFTLSRVICVSAEYRELFQSPPTCSHSRDAG